MRAIASLGCEVVMRAIASSMSPYVTPSRAPHRYLVPVQTVSAAATTLPTTPTCDAAILRSAYSGFFWTPPVLRHLFEVNSEPHTGARPSVRLCVGLMKGTINRVTRTPTDYVTRREKSARPQRPSTYTRLTSCSTLKVWRPRLPLKPLPRSRPLPFPKASAPKPSPFRS